PRRPHTLRGEQHIDPPARPQIEDCLTGLKIDERGRIPAAKGRRDGGSGESGSFCVRIQIRGNGVTAAACCGATTPFLADGTSDLPVFLATRLLHWCVGHGKLLVY